MVSNRLYGDYAEFKTALERTATQDIEKVSCRDKVLYGDYLEDAKLEDAIDALSCSIQQQEMNALYHMKYGEEGEIGNWR